MKQKYISHREGVLFRSHCAWYTVCSQSSGCKLYTATSFS